jgi:hypothetical protein
MKKRTLRDLVLAGAMAAGLGVAGCITSNEEENQDDFINGEILDEWYVEPDSTTGVSCKNINRAKDFGAFKTETCKGDADKVSCETKIDEQKKWCDYRGSEQYFIDEIERFNAPVSPEWIQQKIDSLIAIINRDKNERDKIVDPVTGFSCNAIKERLRISNGPGLCTCRDLKNYNALISGEDKLEAECDSTGYTSMGEISSFEWVCRDSLFLYYPELTESGVKLNAYNTIDMAFNKKRTYCALEQFAKGLRGQKIIDACKDDYETFKEALKNQNCESIEEQQILCLKSNPGRPMREYEGCGIIVQ